MLKFWRRRHEPASPAWPAPGPAPEQLSQWSQALLAGTSLSEVQEGLATALQTWPTHGDLLMLHGRALRLQGNPAQALQQLEQSLAETSHPGEVQTEIALCHLATHQLALALDCLQVAVTLQPKLGLSWLLLGDVLVRFDRFTEARDAFAQAVPLFDDDPLHSHALLRWAQALTKTGDAEQSKAAFRACLDQTPDNLDAVLGLGHAELWLDNEPAAAAHFEAALARIDRPPRELLVNYGSALQSCGRYDEARQVFARVVTEHPTDFVSQWYLCQLDLALCRWPEGWSRYGSRFTSGALPYRPMPFRRWDGTAQPDTTLLVLADEGLGDEIMYASCFAETAGRVGKVIVECEPRLHTLLARSFPQISFVPTRRENSLSWLEGLGQPDWQIPSGDLPVLFRRSDDTFPQHAGYLRADPDRVQHWKQRLAAELGAGLKVGLSWRGGTVRTRTRARSLDPGLLEPILAIPGVSFVNLQYGDYQAELDILNACFGTAIRDYPEVVASYDETAALVSALDVVVTVCTSIVHLAGGLNVPTWILTPLAPGWRYTAHRDSMPWYPSTRIFRQQTWGEWQPPCQNLAHALTELTICGDPSPAVCDISPR
ncbi:MAG: tetratricopeptide repeat protein [Burkholderiales bacterium]